MASATSRTMKRLLFLIVFVISGCQATISPQAPSRLWTDVYSPKKKISDAVRERLWQEGITPAYYPELGGFQYPSGGVVPPGIHGSRAEMEMNNPIRVR